MSDPAPIRPEDVHFADHHAEPEPEGPGADLARERDELVLTTVGVDVGSTTSHLMFARLTLERLASALSSRFVVAERRVLHRSPILLTPYRDDGRIDADALGEFVARAYADAGLRRDDVDTGAVILTGAALERANARAIAELFAAEGGKFVCAMAGHRLEALLAAHGSGAVARSRARGETVLNVDVGGGTSKLALVERGEVVAVAAVAAGARLVAFDDDGRVTRVEPSLAAYADRVPRLGERLDEPARRAIAERMADVVLAAAGSDALDDAVLLAGPLPREPRPSVVTVSGGVGEILHGADAAFGDLGGELAAALRRRASEWPASVAEPAERIRATVVGASQFTVQVSGSTIWLSHADVLPLRDVPVARVAERALATPSAAAVADAVRAALARLELEGGGERGLAVALPWHGEPRHATLRALAEGVARAAGDARPLVVALETDAARSLGAILRDELGVAGALVVVDGVTLEDLDVVDLGRLTPQGVVPVVVKSLVFPR